MKQVKKHMIGLLIMLYAIWILSIVGRTLIREAIDIFTHNYLPGYFSISWYLYLGSWISCIFFFLSALRCIRASIICKSWKYIFTAGVLGMCGYCVPMITFSIYVKEFYSVLPHGIVPLCIALIGLGLRRSESVSDSYTPLLGCIIKHKR